MTSRQNGQKECKRTSRNEKCSSILLNCLQNDIPYIINSNRIMQTTPDTWKSLNNCCSGTNDSTIWNFRTPVSRPCWPWEVGTSVLPRWRPCWLQRRIDRSSSRRASIIWGRGTLTVWIWTSSIREAEEVPQRTSTGSPHLFRYTQGHERLWIVLSSALQTIQLIPYRLYPAFEISRESF